MKSCAYTACDKKSEFAASREMRHFIFPFFRSLLETFPTSLSFSLPSSSAAAIKCDPDGHF